MNSVEIKVLFIHISINVSGEVGCSASPAHLQSDAVNSQYEVQNDLPIALASKANLPNLKSEKSKEIHQRDSYLVL